MHLKFSFVNIAFYPKISP